MAKLSKKDLIKHTQEAGFFRARIFSPDEEFVDQNLKPGTKSVLMVALSYYVESDSLETDYSAGEIAPFARRNYYQEVSKRLKGLLRYIRKQTGIGKQEVRIFSNSRFPEKYMAAACGLGFYGKNSLIITPEGGSLCVLGGMQLPLEFKGDSPLEGGTVPGENCGTCTLCQEECPSNAIPSPGIINQERCIQALSSQCDELPNDILTVWGKRIYGCQICQDVCPFNKKPVAAPECNIGVIGPAVPLKDLLKKSNQDIKDMIKKTAMDMAWIDPEAFKRNAIIAAAHAEAKELSRLLEKYKEDENPIIRKTARWALSYMESIHYG